MLRISSRGMALSLLMLLIAITTLSAATALAGVPGSTSKTNTDDYGLALRGYDPVAYFTIGRPTHGNERISTTYDGTLYLFATEEDRKLFVSNPEKYLPQFGGFCAVGTANGQKVDTDPTTGVVVNGKLYLNYNAKVFSLFEKDTPGIINRANSNWPEVKDQAF